MADRLIMFGAGGHAKVVAEAWLAAHPDGSLVALDDDPSRVGKTLLGREISGGREWLSGNWTGVAVHAALGDNGRRAALLGTLRMLGRPLRTIIHPSATVSASCRIGDGAFLAAGTVVNAEARIGEGAILNTGASVDHDCVIGAFAHIAPGARLCGNVSIGDRALVGTASALIPGVSVGADAVIGAGSAVVRDVPDGETWAGCPARPIGMAR